VENKEGKGHSSQGGKQRRKAACPIMESTADSMHELAKDHCFLWHRKAEDEIKENFATYE